MKSNDYYYIAQEKTTSYIIENTGEQTETTTETKETPTENTNQPSGGTINWFPIIVIYAVIIGWLFFNNRKQKKREKSVKEMQEAIKIGDDVYTTSGFYGKVSDVLENQYVVEFGTNKGVRIPVKKSEVYPVKALEQDESKKGEK